MLASREALKSSAAEITKDVAVRVPDETALGILITTVAEDPLVLSTDIVPLQGTSIA